MAGMGRDSYILDRISGLSQEDLLTGGDGEKEVDENKPKVSGLSGCEDGDAAN